jgi:hypothetical protein
MYTAKLQRYDHNQDLAILDVYSITTQDPITLAPSYFSWKLTDTNIGETIRVYGYPNNGWDTITMTEWKLSGYLDGNYKIDANLDWWNSGGWAYNLKQEFIGIPYAVRSGYTTLWYVIPAQKIQRFIQNKNQWIIYNTWDTIFIKTLKRDLALQWRRTISNQYAHWTKFLWFQIISFNANLAWDRLYYTLQSMNKKTFVTLQKNKIISTSGIFSIENLNDLVDKFGYNIDTDPYLTATIRKDVKIGRLSLPRVYQALYTKNWADSFYNKYYINGAISITIFGDSIRESKADIQRFLSSLGSYLTIGASDVIQSSSIDMWYMRYAIQSTGYALIAPPLFAQSNSLVATIRDGKSVFTATSWYYPDFESQNSHWYTFEKYVLEWSDWSRLIDSGKTTWWFPYVIVYDPKDDLYSLYTIAYQWTSAQILSIILTESNLSTIKIDLKKIADWLSNIRSGVDK